MADIQLKKDVFFDRLIYKLPVEQYTILEHQTILNGCTTEIFTWNGTVISEYDLFEICSRYSIPMKISHIFATSKEEVMAWICRNQMKRNDLPDNMRKYLIGKLYIVEHILGAHAASQKRMQTKAPKDIIIGEPRYEEKMTALRERLGKESNISFATVCKYELYSQAIDIIYDINTDFTARALSNELKISQETIVAISHLTPKQILNTTSDIMESRASYYNEPHILRKHRKKETAILPPSDGSIKDMPAFDPDAEIISLSLTIPSWVSSIKRVQASSNISQVSSNAKNRLRKELHKINITIADIMKAIEED